MKALLKFAAVAAAVGAAAVPAQAAEYSWKPDKPVSIIVPWAAGGSTDQATRVVAAELEKALGQPFVIINQPGASGSIGTTTAMRAPMDGYTWAAGAVGDLGSYGVLGMVDTKAEDWNLFFSVANVSVLGANVDTPYKTAKDAIAAMKKSPGKVSVATAGQISSGHNAIELVAKAADVTYKHVTYDGGNPAVIATVAGETELTTQLAVEQVEMIRAKRLRPLAAISDQPLEIEGFGTVPPITKDLPNLKTATNYFGIWIPKGAPKTVVETMQAVWRDKIATSAAVKTYAANRGALFTPIAGDEAQQKARPIIASNSWALFDAGKAKVSPDTLGIKRQ